MPSTLSLPAHAGRRPARRETSASPHAPRPRVRRRKPRGSGRRQRALGSYTDPLGHAHEVVAQQGHAGSVLVIDTDLAARDDRRLVAHLAADEPAGNAALECARYLQDARGRSYRCRLLTVADLRTAPFAEDAAQGGSPASPDDEDLLDEQHRRYRLEPVDTGMSIPELRWRRHSPTGAEGEPLPVSVRDVVARMQAYEPVRAITLAALASHRDDPSLSVTVLAAELRRVLASPIVLNRLLRQTALETIARQELSLSEIAIRCGRVKRDVRGNESGETSWLARRLGMLPEGGRDTPTPWIHSDVLALIARRGLGVSPREVELQ